MLMSCGAAWFDNPQAQKYLFGLPVGIILLFNMILGSVHYLYPGLVPKRNRLGKPFFYSVKGWVISFLNKANGWINYFQYL